ncbi:hypothetical protein L9F63_015791, partial [Diploptera punctata]
PEEFLSYKFDKTAFHDTYKYIPIINDADTLTIRDKLLAELIWKREGEPDFYFLSNFFFSIKNKSYFLNERNIAQRALQNIRSIFSRSLFATTSRPAASTIIVDVVAKKDLLKMDRMYILIYFIIYIYIYIYIYICTCVSDGRSLECLGSFTTN